MNQGMEFFPPPWNLWNPRWLYDETKRATWTPEENKQFETALAFYDKDNPDRWYNVAAMIPGKTVRDVIEQYKELEEDVSDIEAGLIPIPEYTSSSFTLDWVNNQGGFEELKQLYGVGGERGSSNWPPDHESRKGMPWTEEEHRKFLTGLEMYGKGDWRNISHNVVISRTPIQVASHAQKYFARQISGGKYKRRSSIHDITSVNLTETQPPDHSITVKQHFVMNGITEALYNRSAPNELGASMAFNQPNTSLINLAPHYGTSSNGLELQ